MDTIEIRDLIIRYLDKVTSAEENKKLEELLNTNHEAAEQFHELSLQHVVLYRLAKAKPYTKRKLWTPALRTALAAAAALALAAGVFWYAAQQRLGNRSDYNAPRISGDFSLSGGDELARNVTITTGSKPAAMELGNYCQVKIDPATQVTLKGDDGAEALELLDGTVHCDIESSQGTFRVDSKAGSVQVFGTAFTISSFKLPGEEDDADRMYVKVTEGTVLLEGSWGEIPAEAGTEMTLPDNLSNMRMLAHFEFDRPGIFDIKDGMIKPVSSLISNAVRLEASQSISFADSAPENWGKYRYLKFDSFNPSSKPAAVTITIKDRHADNQYFWWFTHQLEIAPGKDTAVIDLQSIQRGDGSPHSPQQSPALTREEIRAISIRAAADAGYFFIDNIRVEKQ